MAGKARVCPRCIHGLQPPVKISRRYASSAASYVTPAPSVDQMMNHGAIIEQYNPNQPPSYKRPEFRRTQLLRQYAALLQTSPLMIFFQHSNLKANEWVGIRRELAKALRKVDADRQSKGLSTADIAEGIRLQVMKSGVLYTALRIVEYFDPSKGATDEDSLTHVVSRNAYNAHTAHKGRHPLEALLNGPVACLTMPVVSPDHLKAAMQILCPKAPDYPAPKRRANPGLYELPVQTGLRKLLLLGARVDGQAFDFEGARWVGMINGGLDGLRGQLVAMLQSHSSSLASTLQAASSNLWLTMESRRSVLEEEQNPKTVAQVEEAPKAE